MLRLLTLKNFTAFPEAALSFSPGLNVFVGENGLGKTHLLKLAYALLAVSARGEKDSLSSAPTKEYLDGEIAKKLQAVFRPDELGRLASRQRGRQRAEVDLQFDDETHNVAFGFSTASRSKVDVTNVPEAWSSQTPVYLPTRELLTIYPGFVSLYDTAYTQFDETWRDTCLLLGAPLARGPKEKEVARLLQPMEEAMGGRITLDEKGFYLKTAAGEIEMHLVAEGLRKLAMVARLIATGSLLDKGYLFWDEPESNLNPRLIKRVARTIFDLSRQGIQVFIATHSLFLMRELQILQWEAPAAEQTARYFGLHRDGGVVVTAGETIDDIGDIAALDEDIEQSERLMDTLDELANRS